MLKLNSIFEWKYWMILHANSVQFNNFVKIQLNWIQIHEKWDVNGGEQFEFYKKKYNVENKIGKIHNCMSLYLGMG
jgi:hypothetical protein